MHTQKERLIFLINYLVSEHNIDTDIPEDEAAQKLLLRKLMNIRKPLPVSDEFLKIQDEYLQEELKKADIVDIKDLKPLKEHLYLWQGDITLVKTDAVVNAANSTLLGCFIPAHNCIDNAIHSKAGIQLRLECNRIMVEQNNHEPVGMAKITPAYNLPAKYIIHTVGPQVNGRLTSSHCEKLSSCYRSCLYKAMEYNIKSIAFCCIGTGVFNFPNQKGAEIAIQEVLNFLQNSCCEMNIVFNVFKDVDYEIYKGILSKA